MRFFARERAKNRKLNDSRPLGGGRVGVGVYFSDNPKNTSLTT